MILLTVEEIEKIHSKLILKTGGTDGVRDYGLLESAILSANTSFDDIEVYKSIEEKSARLAFAVIGNHAFIDGNKRIGIMVMLLTLKLNDVKIFYSQNEFIELGLGIACGDFNYQQILTWITNHKIQ